MARARRDSEEAAGTDAGGREEAEAFVGTADDRVDDAVLDPSDCISGRIDDGDAVSSVAPILAADDA